SGSTSSSPAACPPEIWRRIASPPEARAVFAKLISNLEAMIYSAYKPLGDRAASRSAGRPLVASIPCRFCRAWQDVCASLENVSLACSSYIFYPGGDSPLWRQPQESLYAHGGSDGHHDTQQE